MEFKQMIETNKFSLVVSLPSNKLELAQAALDGGAQAVKVHCNVWHRASGHTFGTYAENREFLRQLIKLCGDVLSVWCPAEPMPLSRPRIGWSWRTWD